MTQHDHDTMQIVAGLFSKMLSLDVPSADTDLLAEELIDSVTLVQLILALEERFGITIQLDELEFEDLKSIRTIAALVAGKARSGPPAHGGPVPSAAMGPGG